ncbi:hypothetical protein PLICRDRAFT_150906 [Plicaturopsis crispa FD-325 SS-3]|nr:hypothetical protein PLICRDRAFT_150906 [Plicaturopsis crispa FD-325 SS-3]
MALAPSNTASYQHLRNNTNSKWWRDAGLRKTNLIVCCYMIAQATGGYDKSLINGLQSIPQWKAKLGNPDASSLGLITASLSLGVIAGSAPFGWLADYYGRRITMFLGSLIMFVGAVLQAAAHGRNEFIAGRVLIGFGVAGSLCSGPLLVSEISHPRQRATMCSFYNTTWYIGSIVVAWLTFGTSFMSGSDWAWRIPCIGQAVPAFLLLCVVYWLPESPRWLVRHNRADEALALLAKLHANGDVNDELVQFEFAEIVEALKAEDSIVSKGYISDWLELVRTPGNRYRMFLITFMIIGIDWCGTSIISYYLSPILSLVGITSASQQTGINGGLQIWNYITSVTGAMLAERLGRRKLWLISFGGMLLVNIPFGACSALFAEKNNIAAGRAVIALIFLYSGAYNLGCNPLPYTYTVEMLPYGIRSKGLSWEVAWDAANGVAGQYANPSALASLQWKYYFIYTAFLVVIVGVVYFTFVETKGLTLEEVSVVFGDAPEKVEELRHEDAHQVQDKDKESAESVSKVATAED